MKPVRIRIKMMDELSLKEAAMGKGSLGLQSIEDDEFVFLLEGKTPEIIKGLETRGVGYEIEDEKKAGKQKSRVHTTSVQNSYGVPKGPGKVSSCFFKIVDPFSLEEEVIDSWSQVQAKLNDLGAVVPSVVQTQQVSFYESNVGKVMVEKVLVEVSTAEQEVEEDEFVDEVVFPDEKETFVFANKETYSPLKLMREGRYLGDLFLESVQAGGEEDLGFVVEEVLIESIKENFVRGKVRGKVVDSRMVENRVLTEADFEGFLEKGVYFLNNTEEENQVIEDELKMHDEEKDLREKYEEGAGSVDFSAVTKDGKYFLPITPDGVDLSKINWEKSTLEDPYWKKKYAKWESPASLTRYKGEVRVVVSSVEEEGFEIIASYGSPKKGRFSTFLHRRGLMEEQLKKELSKFGIEDWSAVKESSEKMVKFECEDCGGKFQASEFLLNRSVKCPHCGGHNTSEFRQMRDLQRIGLSESRRRNFKEAANSKTTDKPSNLRSLNSWLHAHGVPASVEVVKSPQGYFFSGKGTSDWPVSNVGVYRVSHLSYGGWLSEYHELSKEGTKAVTESRRPVTESSEDSYFQFLKKLADATGFEIGGGGAGVPYLEAPVNDMQVLVFGIGDEDKLGWNLIDPETMEIFDDDEMQEEYTEYTFQELVDFVVSAVEENAGEEEGFEDEPDEESITTEDHEHWYQYGKLYFTGSSKELRAKMDEDQYWPNVFFISDHGNAHVITDFTESRRVTESYGQAPPDEIQKMYGEYVFYLDFHDSSQEQIERMNQLERQLQEEKFWGKGYPLDLENRNMSKAKEVFVRLCKEHGVTPKEFTESCRVTEARLSPDQTQAIAQEIADLCKKLGWKYDVRPGGDVLTITKEFTPGDRDEFVQADGEYYDILSLLPTSSSGSTWGTDGSGIGALSAIKNGLFRMNKSGGNKTVLKKLQKLVQGKTVTESRKPCSRKRSLKESTTTEVSTKYSDPRKAAEDIVRQLKQDPVWGKELSDVQVIEGKNGEVLIAMEVAFDAASGFVDGTGIFGYEGFGEMGPVFDRESSRVHLEPYDSASLQVFRESRRRRPVKESYDRMQPDMKRVYLRSDGRYTHPDVPSDIVPPLDVENCVGWFSTSRNPALGHSLFILTPEDKAEFGNDAFRQATSKGTSIVKLNLKTGTVSFLDNDAYENGNIKYLPASAYRKLYIDGSPKARKAFGIAEESGRYRESRRRRPVKESVSDNSAYVKWMDSKGKLHLKKFEADPLEPNRAARNRASEYMRKNLKDNPDVKQHWVGLYRDLDESEKSLKESFNSIHSIRERIFRYIKSNMNQFEDDTGVLVQVYKRGKENVVRFFPGQDELAQGEREPGQKTAMLDLDAHMSGSDIQAELNSAMHQLKQKGLKEARAVTTNTRKSAMGNLYLEGDEVAEAKSLVGSRHEINWAGNWFYVELKQHPGSGPDQLNFLVETYADVFTSEGAFKAEAKKVLDKWLRGKGITSSKLEESFKEPVSRGKKVLEANDTPLREMYGIPDEVKMPARVRARVRKEISEALSESYYKEIPIQEIDDVLRKHGYLLIQEDYTPWNGMLVGTNAMAFFRIGQIEGAVETQYSKEKLYPQVSNTGIQMTWYKMPSGKYEIVAYLT